MRTKHRTVDVDGLQIFYREAGDPAAPTLLLLHGLPTSSRMFRNLIPALADEFHLVAPDYPGFGHSSFPPPGEFEYSFEQLTHVVERFIEVLGLERFSLYVQDYGAPIGLQFPPHVELTVTATEPGVRGDTASGGVTKLATLETGLEVRVPLFIKEGEKVRVHTETREFAGRA